MPANIILYTAPQPINFVDSEIKVQLRSTNQYALQGIKATASINFDVTILQNHSFSLTWNNKVETFTFKDVVDTNGANQLYSDIALSPSGVFKPIDQKIPYHRAIFERNYQIIKDFDISIDANYNLVLTAKNTGSEYNITFTSISGNVSCTTTAGQNLTLRPNFKAMLKTSLFDNAENLYKVLGEDRLPVDNDGIAEFNLSGLVKNIVETEFNFPQPNKVNIVPPRYKIGFDFGEFFDNQVPRIYSSEKYILIPGGLSREMIANIEQSGGISDFFGVRKDFLTNAPSEKIVSIRQPEYLTYLVADDTPSIVVKTRIDKTSGTTFHDETILVSKGDRIELFTQVQQYQAIYGNDITKIILWLETPAGLYLTSKRVYKVDASAFRSEHYFLFKNMFGCVDTIRFSDAYTKEADIQRDEYIINSDNTGLQRIGQDINFSFPLTFSINKVSQHAPNVRHFTEFLNEFLLSKIVKLIDGNDLLPAILTTKDGIIADTKTGDFSIKIEAIVSTIDPHHKSDIKTANTGIFSNKFNNNFKK